MDHDRTTVSFAAVFRQEEEIFEVKTRAREEGGEIVKEEGEADRDAIDARKQNFCARVRAEEMFAHLRGCRSDFVRQLFVFGKGVNEIEHQGNVVGRGGADGKGGHDLGEAAVNGGGLSRDRAWHEGTGRRPIACCPAICADDTRLP